MSKGASKAPTAETEFCKSAFTLSFAVEVLGLEVWEDCNGGWMEQEACTRGLKLQCQLYPGRTFDLDILIWPHTAKVFCGAQQGWVRVWQLLERRWLAFSISFAFAVRVMEMRAFVATVTPSFGVTTLGSNAKGEKNTKVLLPPLTFGVRRYFAPVLEYEETLEMFVMDLIWQSVEPFIPSSCFDIPFEIPTVVKDVRHQDTLLDFVRDGILRRHENSESDEQIPVIDEKTHKDNKSQTKQGKEKDKKKSEKFEIRLAGESILAGTGRVVPFETVGDLPTDSPEIIVLISSNNLPAQDDLPIVFLNVGNLYQIPLNELKILRITHLYTKWKVGDEVHSSEHQPLRTKSTINFNHHRALPIPNEMLSKIKSDFLDTCFNVELRGIRLPSVTKRTLLFGYEKSDRDFGQSVPKPFKEELDILIAVTHIDAKHLARGINAYLNGEYPLYPPRVSVKPLDRESLCTNDINHVRKPLVPDIIVPPGTILEAQMTLEVSLGVVGCKTRKLSDCFSRIFCLIRDTEPGMAILRCIQEINEDIMLTEKKQDLLSGFALDTGSVVILYVEGPRQCHILRIWEMTEDFYPKVKPLFSCSDRYSTRIYPELITTPVPFIVLKMFLPLGVVLACPPVYARPALPLPTRSAVLKIGRLIVCDFRSFPSRCLMPTTAELKSFRLEMCVAPRPTPVVISDNVATENECVTKAYRFLLSTSRALKEMYGQIMHDPIMYGQ